MIGALGTAADVWQALRDAQSGQPSSASFPQPASTGTTPSTPAPAANPVGQLVTDVQSLLTSLQAGTTASTASGTDPLAAVQADLQKLSTGGPQPGHHHHHGSAGSVQTDAQGSAANLASASTQNDGLVSAIAKAITAYQASATSGATASATA